MTNKLNVFFEFDTGSKIQLLRRDHSNGHCRVVALFIHLGFSPSNGPHKSVYWADLEAFELPRAV